MSGERTLVIGLGVTGESVARRLAAGGTAVAVVDDRPDGAGLAERADGLRGLGVEVVLAPTPGQLAELVESAGMVVPSPGVPEAHPVYGLAETAGVPVRSEIELAAAEARRRGRPLVAVTGTNGKTTVTTLISEILTVAGLSAPAAGNIGRPLLDAVHDHGIDVVVAEVSSFQLRFTDAFRPSVAVLLNAAQDHLDWHPGFDAYLAAKARIFANQAGDDLLVANADDEPVARAAAAAPARVETFTIQPGASSGYRIAGGHLVDSCGTALIALEDLPRRGPHDLANALAAAAACVEMGNRRGKDGWVASAKVLQSFAGLPHRVTVVGQTSGVRFVDDSKATNPHAALAAIAGFESVVLIAGGKNKGLDLGVLRREAGRIRAVIAIGEAAPEVEASFAGSRPTQRAASMADAVRLAAGLAQAGDAVLLSPACASFDWYSGYAARGDDFTRCVRALMEESATS